MPKGRLLDVVRDRIRVKHYSYRTETSYLGWIRRFIRFHGGRHPREMGGPEVEQFLSYLATERKVVASTQNQALSAILFLYRDALEIDLPWLDGVVRAKRPARIPVVLSRDEVRRILAQLEGAHWLAANLLYGSGLRVSECLRLRVKDLDFEYRQITVRDGKGAKDRCTMLPDSVLESLQFQLKRVRSLFEADRAAGHPGTALPPALERKYPSAPFEWPWQFAFPARKFCRSPYTGHVVRFHLLESGYDIRTVQEPLGHSDVSTTMIYTHVIQRGGRGVRSPLD